MNRFAIAPAGVADLPDVIALFRAYAASLPVDLAYQGFEAELAALPGKYAPPSGALLLARDEGGAALGCVALRPLAPDICEMKRLYVRPDARGSGAGLALAQAIVTQARRAGYAQMRLDSLPTMQRAIAMYRTLGFAETAPYYDSPVAGTVFLSLDLRKA